jgi:PAS domain S-box-containing protein
MKNDQNHLLKHIQLSLKDEDREDMKAFHVFFLSVEKEFYKELEKKLHNHSVIGKSLLEISRLLKEEQKHRALKLQYDAIFNNNWEALIEEQTNQGIGFAKMGIDFSIWYDILAFVRDTFRPFLLEGNKMDNQEIFTILKGKNRFFDIQMCIISEAYLTEKQRVIEEQKKKLTKSEEGQNQAQALAHIGNWESDFLSGKLSWSDEAFRILGFKPGEVEPSKEVYLSKVYPADQQKVRISLEESEKQRQPSSLIHRILRKPGDVRIVRAESRVLHNEEGVAVGMYGVLEDITERKLAATENERLSNVIQKSLNEIYMFNSDSLKFEYVNEGALKNLGYTLDEMLHMTPKEIIPKYTPSKFEKLVELLIDKKEEKIVFETECKRKDGSQYPVEVHLQLMKEDYKRIFVAIIIDITERKKAENVNKRNADLLAFQNAQLADFCNIVSHNLRAPLVNMNMLVDLIETSRNEKDKQKLIEKFKPIINNVNETFNELLESLQIQQDLEVKSEPLFVRDYFKKVVKGFEGQITHSRAIIEGDFEDAPVIHFPPKYFSSILHNLISNSLKYKSTERRPYIYVKTIRKEDKVILSVKDNGLGIDLHEHKNDLFKIRKVFHYHSDAKGFGLYITKTQIETMGGRIWVESQPGVGSTFYVEIKNEDFGINEQKPEIGILKNHKL